ncbi:hypothetical protein RchiOBHm_Chr5g0032981 [Rosa chinensis]|uniref:Uncharacterized protein n=1 Tax=Rosa chinensis TaxID=74649 RepID=A0A2P6QAK9_ROSCH|nr:hypothetical protein RchiOBHm_Chr5g0032981 [Rosa chinensis]
MNPDFQWWWKGALEQDLLSRSVFFFFPFLFLFTFWARKNPRTGPIFFGPGLSGP